ncbi:MAG: hypothetical protein R3Y62_03485 [Eubacteriales bacterium]
MIESKNEKILHFIEILVVVLMGLTALLTAWASWVGSLHGGNQATNYTVSTNLASEGNSEYNAGSQLLMQDMMLWAEISDLQLEVLYGTEDDAIDMACTKLYWKMVESLPEYMATEIAWDYPDVVDDDYYTVVSDWMYNNEYATISPFYDEDYVQSYYDAANELLAESDAVLTQGKADNSNGDAFGLVTVIFTVSLFLLGMISTMEDIKNKYALLAISIVSIVFATIYMLTIPLPTGFSLTSFFG